MWAFPRAPVGELRKVFHLVTNPLWEPGDALSSFAWTDAALVPELPGRSCTALLPSSLPADSTGFCSPKASMAQQGHGGSGKRRRVGVTPDPRASASCKAASTCRAACHPERLHRTVSAWGAMRVLSSALLSGRKPMSPTCPDRPLGSQPLSPWPDPAPALLSMEMASRGTEGPPLSSRCQRRREGCVLRVSASSLVTMSLGSGRWAPAAPLSPFLLFRT